MTSGPSSRPPGTLPPGVHTARDYEPAAQAVLPAATWSYLSGGSGHDRAANANRQAFGRWHVVPRLLRDLRNGHSRVRLGAQPLAHPLVLAPVAYQQLAHPGAERETARAAEATDTLMVLSTGANTRLEDIAQPPGQPHWFQLYLQPARTATLQLVRRAEDAGFGALVLTLDASLQAPSVQALRAGFRLPADCHAVNLDHAQPPGQSEARTLQPGESRIFQGLMRHAPTLDDLHWLIGQTRLPVWAKGVMHPADARALRSAGVAGLVVSNHGGRALESAPPSLSALPAVRRAVGPDCPLLFDGGVRSGDDAFKALALGANAVAIGRLQVAALAAGGALGVAHMLRLLREELELTMALAGCASPAHITRDCLQPADEALGPGANAGANPD